MTPLVAFLVAAASTLGVYAAAFAWLARRPAPSLKARAFVGASLCAGACAIPFAAAAVMGWAEPTSLGALPMPAQLIAFREIGGGNLVDLWLIAGGPRPRAYEVRLTSKLRQTLEAARGRMQSGQPAFLDRPRPAAGPPAPGRSGANALTRFFTRIPGAEIALKDVELPAKTEP